MSNRKFQVGDYVMLSSSATQELVEKHHDNVGKIEGYKPAQGYYSRAYYIVRFPNCKYTENMDSRYLKKADRHSVLSDRESIEEAMTSVKDKILSLRSDLELLQQKLAFMDENAVDEFDETEFKSYRVLLTIEQGNMTRMEKAKAIASIVGG